MQFVLCDLTCAYSSTTNIDFRSNQSDGFVENMMNSAVTCSRRLKFRSQNFPPTFAWLDLKCPYFDVSGSFLLVTNKFVGSYCMAGTCSLCNDSSLRTWLSHLSFKPYLVILDHDDLGANHCIDNFKNRSSGKYTK